MKTLIQTETGRTFKMGRNRPIARGPRFLLKNYIKSTLPTPPESVSYTPAAATALAQMYDNDTLGDCVIACMGHTEGVFTGNATGTSAILPNSEIISLYSAIGGYVPENPSTDNGCDEQTAWNYWQQNGLSKGANKIKAWLSVDATRLPEVRAAIWLFENVIFGVELPDAWVNPFPSASGFWWGKAGAPDPDNGHCFGAFGYVPNSLQISTWGMIGNITNGAMEKYANTKGQGELYTVLSMDAINKATQKAPNGFDFDQLLADINSMGITH